MSLIAENLIDEHAAAACLGISVRTLQMRRTKKQAPAYCKIGKSVRYCVADLENLLAVGRVDHAGEAQ